jgi:hypothetical protein
MLNGETTERGGVVSVEFVVNEESERNLCLVAPVLVCGANVILGFDIIKHLGGVAISKDGSVSWGATVCVSVAVQEVVEDTGFSAFLKGMCGLWSGSGRKRNQFWVFAVLSMLCHQSI